MTKSVKTAAAARAGWRLPAVAALLVVSSGNGLGADDLRYDSEAVVRAQRLSSVERTVRTCMRNVSLGGVQRGYRDSEAIMLFAIEKCAPPLVGLLSSEGKPIDEIATYVSRLAEQALGDIPGLRREVEPKSGHGSKSTGQLSELQFKRQFRCPESYASDEESKKGFAESVTWFGENRKPFTVEGFARFRRQLLLEKRCQTAM